MKPTPVSIENDQEELIRSLNTCCLCGHSLHFLHTTDFETLLVKEKASCPECGVKLKENDYKLQ